MNSDSSELESASYTEAPSTGESHSFVVRLAEKMSTAVKAEMIFGEPMEQGGVTVIPVARARWGFGGGGGGEPGKEGSGGGGGVDLHPVGFIQIAAGRAEFKPIRDRSADLQILAFGGVLGLMLLRSLRKGRRRE